MAKVTMKTAHMSESQCQICGGTRLGIYCNHCENYDVYISRHPYIKYLFEGVIIAAFTGLIIGYINYLFTNREKQREASENSRTMLIEAYRNNMSDLDKSLDLALKYFNLSRELNSFCPLTDENSCRVRYLELRNKLNDVVEEINFKIPVVVGKNRAVMIKATDRFADAAFTTKDNAIGDISMSKCSYIGVIEKLDAKNAKRCIEVQESRRAKQIEANKCMYFVYCSLLNNAFEARINLLELVNKNSDLIKGDKIVEYFNGTTDVGEFCRNALTTGLAECAR